MGFVEFDYPRKVNNPGRQNAFASTYFGIKNSDTNDELTLTFHDFPREDPDFSAKWNSNASPQTVFSSAGNVAEELDNNSKLSGEPWKFLIVDRPVNPTVKIEKQIRNPIKLDELAGKIRIPANALYRLDTDILVVTYHKEPTIYGFKKNEAAIGIGSDQHMTLELAKKLTHFIMESSTAGFPQDLVRRQFGKVANLSSRQKQTAG